MDIVHFPADEVDQESMDIRMHFNGGKTVRFKTTASTGYLSPGDLFAVDIQEVSFDKRTFEGRLTKALRNNEIVLPMSAHLARGVQYMIYLFRKATDEVVKVPAKRGAKHNIAVAEGPLEGKRGDVYGIGRVSYRTMKCHAVEVRNKEIIGVMCPLAK